MSFSYTATGGVSTIGCAVTSMTRAYFVRFKEGDSAYEKWKAEHRGLIRKHVIKMVNVKTVERTQALIHVLYVDTFNEIWADRELVTHEEALTLAEAYLTQQAIDAENALQKGC